MSKKFSDVFRIIFRQKFRKFLFSFAFLCRSPPFEVWHFGVWMLIGLASFLTLDHCSELVFVRCSKRVCQASWRLCFLCSQSWVLDFFERILLLGVKPKSYYGIDVYFSKIYSRFSLTTPLYPSFNTIFSWLMARDVWFRNFEKKNGDRE